jgi:hypothetical protein
MNSTPTTNRSPLSIVVDTIVAPKSAFEALDARPRWLVAYLIVCAFGMVGAVLQIPAGEHAASAIFDQRAAHDPSMASLTPAQLQSAKSFAIIVQHFIWVMYPVVAGIGITIASLILLVGNAIGRGQGTFAKYFALAANVAVINYGLYYLSFGVLCALHAPDSFRSQADLLRLLPSLAWIVPDATPKLTVLLGGINPFTIWAFALLALGMHTIGKVSAAISYFVAAVIVFGGLLVAVPFAQ